MDCEKDAQDLWRTEGKCLAPYSEKDELCEAVVRSIEHQENGVSYAVVSFMDSTEKKLPLSELHRLPGSSKVWNKSMFDDEDLEKPCFTGRRPPGPSVDFPLSNTGISIPYTINRYLRDYQRDGAKFLYAHYIKSMGCILGDDMGLGKTIQVISFLAAVLHKKGTREDIENNMPEFLRRGMKKDHSFVPPKKVFLIVSPLSVLFNWKDELETWGYFKVTVIHGNKKEFELSRIKQGKYEIALTTYETLRLCLDELNSIDWAAVIVDEAHRIKNPKARVTHVMKDLNCKVRIGLTGTILQNNMQELWCVMDWAVPGCLGSKNTFKEDFANPVEYGQRHNATKRELATGRKAMERLASKMAPLFLRRTKDLISSQLPQKEDRIVYCSLSEFQKAVYQTVLMTQDVNLVLRGGEKCSCNSGQRRRKCCYKENEHGESVRTMYFSYLAILRKVANHAALLQTDTSKKQEAHIKRICAEVFSKFPEFMQQSKDAAFETISDPKYSGKMMVLQQLLNHSRQNKDKVLLFSFSTKLLDVLERYCMASGLDYRRLDGSTKAEDRLKIVKEFNSTQDVNICLVSTMAGGLGLNFVGANVVVVFDPTWNPANDLQAIDRAYRIGQCRDVKVFRLISLGTVEEMIYLRQVYKQQLHCVVVGSENAKRYFEAVQGSKEHKGELFGVHNLFKLRTHGTCLTRDILEREGKVEAGIMSAAMYLSQGKSETPTDTDSEENITHVKHGQQLQNEMFDFSSDSDEEVKGRSKLKFLKSPDIADSRRQLILQQFGFSRMLEKVPRARSMNPDLSGSTINNAHNDCNVNKKNALVLQENSKCPVYRRQSKRVTTPEWNISLDSEDDTYTIRKNKHPTSKEANDVQGTESSSCESDDVIRSSQTPEAEKLGLRLRHMAEFDKPGTSKQQVTDSSCDNISDESDDIKIPNKKNTPVRLRQSKQIRTRKDHSFRNSSGPDKDSQTIDSFSSSDDDDHLHNKKIRLNTGDQRAGNVKGQKQVHAKLQRFTHRSSVKPQKVDVNADINKKIVNKKVDSVDRVLDGVEGVAYIHSNQNVVGSSKAENHMSRRAVRDVFELNQFSQLPANITPPVNKKCEHSAKEGLLLQTKAEASKSDNVLRYPVVHKQRKVCRTGEATFLIGETPKAVRRKQFEEMVAYFRMASAEEFAQHIINVKSDGRQDMLREFYTKQYNVTEDFYPSQAPLPVNVEKEIIQKESFSKKEITIKRKKLLCLLPDRINDSVSSKVMDPHCTNDITNDCTTNTRHMDGLSKAIQEKSSSKHRPAANCIPDNLDLDTVSELVNGKKLPKQCYEKEDVSNVTGSSTKLLSSASKPSPENQPGNRVTGKQKVEAGGLTDLLGDTSILDDLFASQTKRQTEVPVSPEYEEPVTKAKHRPKDFWDILNEQNEDSLNKLTDLSVIEKACEVRALSPVNKKDNWNNALWVKNEKFLWRKNDPIQDVNYGYPGKSSDP